MGSRHGPTASLGTFPECPGGAAPRTTDLLRAASALLCAARRGGRRARCGAGRPPRGSGSRRPRPASAAPGPGLGSAAHLRLPLGSSAPAAGGAVPPPPLRKFAAFRGCPASPGTARPPQGGGGDGGEQGAGGSRWKVAGRVLVPSWEPGTPLPGLRWGREALLCRAGGAGCLPAISSAGLPVAAWLQMRLVVGAAGKVGSPRHSPRGAAGAGAELPAGARQQRSRADARWRGPRCLGWERGCELGRDCAEGASCTLCWLFSILKRREAFSCTSVQRHKPSDNGRTGVRK